MNQNELTQYLTDIEKQLWTNNALGSSLYVNRDSKWKVIFHQQSPVEEGK
jgi:hypothetical protein